MESLDYKPDYASKPHLQLLALDILTIYRLERATGFAHFSKFFRFHKLYIYQHNCNPIQHGFTDMAEDGWTKNRTKKLFAELSIHPVYHIGDRRC